MKSTIDEKPRALLVSIKTPKESEVEAEESLSELERLTSTLGFNVVAKESQKRAHTRNVTVVGEGKLKRLAQYTGGPGFVEKGAFVKKSKVVLKQEEQCVEEQLAKDIVDGEEFPEVDVVVFDCDINPSQLKNLVSALGVEVLDRSGVIIEIFSRHAKTRAAKLQVEIARLNYLAPRLRETGEISERFAGQGAGESAIELDRRNIRDRVVELKANLVKIQKEQDGRRTMRLNQHCVALVGYTNAGKSSTMRALTGSAVYVENKLFATLDTTVRAIQPETHPRILISDTVGFIKKLPHDLVASFRSTLDEAHNASLLLYLVDASDPTHASQLEITREVLAEVGVSETPSLIVLNKSDCLSSEQKKEVMKQYPDAFLMSSKNSDDIKLLREKIILHFEKDMLEEEIFASYAQKGIVGEIRSGMRVLSETFENEGVRFKVRARSIDIQRLKKKFKL